MKPEILMPGPMLASCMEALDEAFDVHRLWEAPDEAAALAELGPRIRGVATAKGCSGALMRALPKLEIVASFGVGYDSVDVQTAQAQGVRVTNTPDVLNDAVAELTVGLMVCLARRLLPCDAYVRTGRWEREGAYPLTAQLAGAGVGILGLGRIGKEIARRLEAMKMTVSYHGRRPQADVPYRYFDDLAAMAAEVDWLVVIAPATPETIGVVDARVMAALGPKGSLVNVARGALVDEPALIEALRTGALGGAALDVFADEPRVPEALRAMEQVVLAPHVGSATHHTRWAMGDCVVRNLKAHFSGAPLVSPVV
ncbi:2-hydroxyacid dehydrogenase [Rubrimonas cliftonensis]|uniref:Lactate dehydrogenase n=1 Tax=Rubrimonas cliftonensis TaxID=89524 RepID=A0A1H3VGV2_9RHOB|nr:2-hydroxyacid dehydrogenase [Rubrimonas cliftonensis]SDZ73960.1 Lactate dehydrogenase [Rubrimonas cliftonensis]